MRPATRAVFSDVDDKTSEAGELPMHRNMMYERRLEGEPGL